MEGGWEELFLGGRHAGQERDEVERALDGEGAARLEAGHVVERELAAEGSLGPDAPGDVAHDPLDRDREADALQPRPRVDHPVVGEGGVPAGADQSELLQVWSGVPRRVFALPQADAQADVGAPAAVEHLVDIRDGRLVPDQVQELLAKGRVRHIRPDLERGALRGVLAEAERSGGVEAVEATFDGAAAAPGVGIEGVVGVVRVEAAVHAHLDVRDRAPGGVFDPGELDRALGQEERAVDVGEQGAADLVARVGHEVHLPVRLEGEQVGRQEPVGDGLALEGAPQLKAPGDAPDAGDPVRVEGAVQPHHTGLARRGPEGRDEPTVDRGQLIGEAGHAQVDRPQSDGVAPGRDHPDPQVSNDHLGALREEVEGGLIPLADPLHVHAEGLGELQDAALEHHAVQVQTPVGGPPHP